jgi:glycerol-3-phosphate acyltransferase PlsX
LTSSLTLSIDAMGGDNAPAMVLDGLEIAATELPGLRYLLFGDRDLLEPLLDKLPRARSVCEIRHTKSVVTNDDTVSVALRSGRESSMRLAINAAAAGEAGGVVSAGNTGALMAMAKFVFKTLPGIDRPAIAGRFPTQQGSCVMLDLGANVDCDENNLLQFAIMGEVYARYALGIKKPTIGLLNIGVEGLKGNEAVRKAATALQETDLPVRFHGFIEGDDICAGTVDVVVTDGFSGNIALKTAEGTVRMFAHFLREAVHSSIPSRLGALLASPALRAFRARLDPSCYNGAMFLGLNGICVKSHGGTDPIGFANAIKVAHKLITDQVNDGIKEDYARFKAAGDKEQEDAAG